MTTTLNGGNPVLTEADLNAALAAANAETAGAGAFEIDLGASISLDGALQSISLADGVSLDIAGGGATVDGGGTQAGFVVAAGSVTLQDMTIANTLAAGANGGGASGGNAGLGGGVYVGATAAVTLAGVSFTADTAMGGAGGAGNNGANGAYVYRLFQGNVPVEGAGGQGGSGGAFGQGGGGGNGGVGRTDPYGYEEPNGGAGGSGGFGGGSGGYGGQGGSDSPVAGGGGGGGGGGGLGAGGDVYVETGGSLTISGALQWAGSAVGGSGAGGGAGAGGNTDSSIGYYLNNAGHGYAGVGGDGYGGSIFLRGGQTLTFAPDAGETETILGSVADVSGSSGSSDPAGAGALELNGAGLLDLAAANTFIGGVTLQSGTLELSAAGAAGSGAITFAGASETVEVTAAALQGLGNSLTGFAVGDAIDLLGIVATGVTINASNQLVATNDGAAVATFNLGTIPAYVGAISDGAGGTLILAEASPPPAVSLPLSPYVGAGQTVSIGGIILSDPAADTVGAPVTLTLSDTTGLLEATGQGVSGSGTAALTITGSTYEVDATLTTLSYTAPGAGGALADTLSIVATDTLGGVSQTSLPLYISQPVTTEAQLNAAIVRADDAVAGSGVITIDVGGDIGFGAELLAINLHAGVSLDIRGNGYSLDGGGAWRGLLVYSGAVSVEDLTLANMAAIGRAGAGSGGGGAGLGGGLFVANDAADGAAPGAVTLSNVDFVNDSASGGGGGATGLGGGGGGLGGAGSAAEGGPGSDSADTGGGGVGAQRWAERFFRSEGQESWSGPGTAAAARADRRSSMCLAPTKMATLAAQDTSAGPAGASAEALGLETSVMASWSPSWASAAPEAGVAAAAAATNSAAREASGAVAAGAGAALAAPARPAGSAAVAPAPAPAPTSKSDRRRRRGQRVRRRRRGRRHWGRRRPGGRRRHLRGVRREPDDRRPGIGGPGRGERGGRRARRGERPSLRIRLVPAGRPEHHLAPAQGQTITIAGVIADMTGSDDPSGATGAGALVDAGPGTLVLSATNTFTGGLIVDGGTVELAAAGAAGSGTITLAGTVALVLDAVATPSNGETFADPIAGFADGDQIDLRGSTYTPDASAVLAGGVLTVSSNGENFSLDLPGATASAYYAHADGVGGVLVTTSPAPKSAWKSPVSGDWSVGGDWTAGSAPDDAVTDLTIGAAGGYTVSIAAGETYEAENLNFSNARGVLNLAGTLNLSGALTLTGGRIALSGLLDGGGLSDRGHLPFGRRPHHRIAARLRRGHGQRRAADPVGAGDGRGRDADSGGRRHPGVRGGRRGRRDGGVQDRGRLAADRRPDRLRRQDRQAGRGADHRSDRRDGDQ